MLKRTSGEKYRNEDDVNHEQRDTLQVNDEDFAGERGDGKE